MKPFQPYADQLKEIVQGSFPPWVWQRSPKRNPDHVPVFTFHSVKAEPFEAQLRFLRQNGYRTVTCDHVLAVVRGERPTNGKEVLLTFDDGQNSVWQVAFPLLQKYDFTATVFVVPSIISHAKSHRPTLEDVWDGQMTLEAIENNTPTPLSWQEIRIMLAEGSVDFQSHSLTHQQIPVSSEITDFICPETIQSHFFKFTLPWMPALHAVEEYRTLLGAPIYAGAPALSGTKRIIPDDAVRRICMDLVGEITPDEFFAQSGWKQLLLTHAKYYRKQHSQPDRFESDTEQKARILHEVQRAREIMQEKLPDHSVIHLAYPWGTGSDLAVGCSREAGYETNFWSTLAGRSKNRPGSDPFHLVRLKHDFIRRLPGHGRLSLGEIFLTKLNRRKNRETAY